MRDMFESLFSCKVLAWAEWDGENETFTVLHNGKIIRADSLLLLTAALTEAAMDARFPLALAA